MKLRPVTEMGPAAGVCCRQSRPRGAIGALVFAALLVGGALVTRHFGAPWFMWGAFAVPAAVVVPVLIRDTLAKFRPTNWVLRVRPDGLWINLRSYRVRPAVKAATVVHLSYDEIDHAHRHIDTWTSPGIKGGSCYWKLQSLDLHVASADTRELARALAEARASDKNASPPVTVPAPGVVRVAWTGHGLNHDVTPGLNRLLAELSRLVPVTDTTRTDRPDWHRLSEAELDEQIEHLVRWREEILASELLRRRRGYSATAAHKHLTELAARA